MGEGRDDVPVELRDRRGAGPPDGSGDTRFFDTGYRPEARLAETASSDDGESVEDTLAFTATAGALVGFGSCSEFKVAGGTDSGATGVEEVGLVLLKVKRFRRELKPLSHLQKN